MDTKAAFINYIHKISPLSIEAKKDIAEKLHIKNFQKGSFIASEHIICKELFFLQYGLIKLYFIKEDGKEIILRFFNENSIFTSIESFLEEKITPHNILTLEPTVIVSISKKELEELCLKHHSVERFYRLFLSKVCLNMINRVSELMKDDAMTRYHKFIFKNNDLSQRISLGDLSNYLGINQVSLSRIRAIKRF